jgi:hypothetical protein
VEVDGVVSVSVASTLFVLGVEQRALVVSKSFIDNLPLAGGSSNGASPEWNLLYQALQSGHIVFVIDGTPKELFDAMSIADVPTQWSSIGQFPPAADHSTSFDPNLSFAGSGVFYLQADPAHPEWFEGWINFSIEEEKDSSSAPFDVDIDGQTYSVDVNLPAYDLIDEYIKHTMDNTEIVLKRGLR